MFLNGQAEKVIGPDRVGAPHGVYKIIGWQKADGKFTARGYFIKQDDTGSDMAASLESIDTIEAETGLDFFADLDDEAEEELESVRFMTLWGRVMTRGFGECGTARAAKAAAYLDDSQSARHNSARGRR